jgi:uncharacterized protein affecting Mg2+/Co2+ transport
MTTMKPSQQHEAILELAHSIYAPMFAERDNLRDAFAYAQEVAKASDNPAAVLTAVYVLTNSIAKQLETIVKGE